MRFQQPLIEGTLIRRHRRFSADIKLRSGDAVTAHCANAGSMLGCSEPGSRVLLSVNDDARRRFRHQMEIVYTGRTAVGIHAGRPSSLIFEAIRQGKISDVAGYATVRRVVRTPRDSVVDMRLDGNGLRPCHIAVIGVTLAHDGVAYFPDAVQPDSATEMCELTDIVREGGRAMIFCLAQRSDVEQLRPADHIDPDFANNFRDAVARGVEAIGYRARVTRKGIELERQLPIDLSV